MEENQKKFLNVLNLAFSSNLEAVIKILSFAPQPEEALKLGENALKKLGLKQKTILNFFKKRNEINIEKEWQNLQKKNIKLIAKDEQEYPCLLKEIAKPPEALYVKGALLQNASYLACVGSRFPSDYGKMVTPDLTGDLANAGFTIVSGMAKGIDTLSHKAALKRGKTTVAITGTGLDIIFPPENKNLAREIEKNGVLISEFPLQTPPLAYNFPARNRIIAGMSLGTLVIEAKKKSGALITANIAVEEGREVFAVPGPILSKTSEGPNNLLKQGAHVITEANDILSIFDLEKAIQAEKEIKGDTEEENLIIKSLKNEPMSIDEIAKKTKIEISKINSSLILMEINGKLKKIGEKYKIP